MTFGLTLEGFNLKRFEDIRANVHDRLKLALGDNINLSPNSTLGQIADIIVLGITELWEIDQSVYNSQVPSFAEGISFDNILAINGLTRLESTYSIVGVVISGTPGTIVGSGFRASVVGDETTVFETTEAYTIEPGGTVDAVMYSVDKGPFVAPAGTLTVIETPVAGVDSVANPLDAEPGRNTETDPDGKLRRKRSLQRSGSSTVEGIRNALEALTGVTKAFVIEALPGTYYPPDQPLKSIQCVVQNGDGQEIAQTIFDSKAAGTQTYGSVTLQVIDSQGIIKDIEFSRPIDIEIFIVANITANANPAEGDVYPANGDDLVRDAILSYGNTLDVNQDVILNLFYTVINTVPGVIGIELLAGGPAYLSFDFNFIAGNTINMNINGVPIAPVLFDTDQATTMANLATEIALNGDVFSATVVDDREIKVVREDGIPLDITDIIVSGGISQPTGTFTSNVPIEANIPIDFTEIAQFDSTRITVNS